VRFVDVSGYIGGGAQYGWIRSGYPSIDRARGAGGQLVFGRRLRDRYPLYLDFRIGGTFVDVGPTTEIAFPSDRADHAVMAVGGLWDFRSSDSRGVGAWASVHATYHNLNWRNASYSIDGFGAAPAVGVHLPIPPIGVFRIGVMGSFFSAKSNYGARVSGQVFQINMDYLYEFRPREAK